MYLLNWEYGMKCDEMWLMHGCKHLFVAKHLFTDIWELHVYLMCLLVMLIPAMMKYSSSSNSKD